MTASAFQLHEGRDGLATLVFDLPGSRVNLFNRKALEDLAAVVEELGRRRDLSCLVLLSGKEGSFSHGADLSLIGSVEDPRQGEEGARAGQALFAAWERLPFPTIAAIDGVSMGGGTELSLASTYRLASDGEDVRIGLPEVRIGIVPGWGGCVRLPRRVGLAEALDLIVTGRAVAPARALKLGLVDAVLPRAGFLHHVREAALERRGKTRSEHDEKHLKELLLAKNPLGRKLLFDQARKRAAQKTGGHYPAPLKAIEVVRAGIEHGEEAGFRAEAEAVGELAGGRVAKNLIHLFQLSREPRGDSAPGGEPIRRAAVVGAGVMGSALAPLVAGKGEIPVRLKDVDPAALGRAMAGIAAGTRNKLDRRRLTRPQAGRHLARIQPGLDYRGFGGVDLVVEAVYESLDLKRRVFEELARHVPAGTILASNTSSLSIDGIAEGVAHPERVLGLHFLNPVHRMQLVEVVAGSRTAPEVVSTAAAFARRLGKVPIQVRDAPGFLVNRLLTFYLAEALWLLEEGATVEDLDHALVAWGMPEGPFALIDDVGIDLAIEVMGILSRAFPERLSFPDRDWQGVFLGAGRLGAKAGAGYYRYEGAKRAGADPEVPRKLGLTSRRRPLEPGLAADRMLLPMVNEAARCLVERVVASPGDLDLGVILGLSFPPFHGGLCRWADHRGLTEVARALDRLTRSAGERFRPSAALLELERRGGFYA